jgi:hypothetical protein
MRREFQKGNAKKPILENSKKFAAMCAILESLGKHGGSCRKGKFGKFWKNVWKVIPENFGKVRRCNKISEGSGNLQKKGSGNIR